MDWSMSVTTALASGRHADESNADATADLGSDVWLKLFSFKGL
jgi:hypothetical protein